MNDNPATAQTAATATALAQAGLTPFLNGEPWGDGVEVDGTAQLSIKLGKGSTQGGDDFLLAFATVDPKSDAFDAISTAATNAGCTPLLERVARSWSERDPATGMVTRFLSLSAASFETFEALLRTLPNRAATVDGRRLAHLRFGGTQLVAPSAVERGELQLVAGTPAEPLEITAAELFGLGVVLDEASDSRDRHARDVHNVRDFDPQTNRVRDRFNRQKDSAADVERLAEDAGWVKTGGSPTSTLFSRAGEFAELLHANRAFVNRGTENVELSDPRAQVLRAFDLLVGTERNRGANRQPVLLGTPERAAQWLLDNDQVALEVEVFAARGVIPTIDVGQPTLELGRAYAQAIQTAKARHDAATPLAMLHMVNGEPQGLVSVTAAGDVVNWTGKNAGGLLIAAGQLAEMKTDKDTGEQFVKSYRHSVQDSIVDLAVGALRKPGMLPPVESFGREPMLTPDGQVVARHGYDADARVFLTIPHRERGRWQREYEVPECPTEADAQAAYEYLQTELLTDFPFETTTARSRAMAFLLTAVGRSITTGSIGFLVSAPNRGTGKSLLLLIGRMLGRGNPAAQEFYFGLVNDPETEKSMATLLKNRGRFLHCDEAPDRALKSKVLQTAITSVDGDGDIRLLGTNEHVKRAGLIISGAGNGVEIGGDLNRRFLQIDLATAPGAKVVGRTGFRHADILGFVRKNRPALLAAAHTVLLHGLQNEPAHEINGMGFSHDWPRRILGAMSHIGVEDDKTAAQLAVDGWFSEVDAQDENSEVWGELVAHLWLKSLGKPKTAKNLILLAKTVNTNAGEVRPPLPPALLGTDDSEFGSRTWAAALRRINRTNIPWDGSTYVVQKVEGRTKSRHAAEYTVTRYADGKIVLPGRLPEVTPSEHADAAAAVAEEADFS